ncbi:acyl carrier protein [Streptomyces sp. NPDC048172]|uniref:acyl carrier protein n=1 Tax=Streptomyces sp. NPDC048172 TaxID=3365505 RepID=UPI00371D7166
MSEQQWDERFVEVLVGALPRLAEKGEFGPDTRLKAAGLDSLAMVELLVRVETAYDIVVPDNELAPDVFETPAKLWSLIAGLRTRQLAPDS